MKHKSLLIDNKSPHYFLFNTRDIITIQCVVTEHYRHKDEIINKIINLGGDPYQNYREYCFDNNIKEDNLTIEVLHEYNIAIHLSNGQTYTFVSDKDIDIANKEMIKIHYVYQE